MSNATWGWVMGWLQATSIYFAALSVLLTAGVLQVDGDDLPDCVKGAPEDVVVYRSQVPGEWDSCAPADDLVGDQTWVDR